MAPGLVTYRMTGDFNEAEATWARIKRLMPRSRDLCLILIKGHLLMEEELERCIAQELPYPAALKEARLECLQKICLVESFYRSDRAQGENLWDNIRKLNQIRNKFAHSLEPPGLEQTVDQWIATNIDPETKFKKSKDAAERARYTRNLIVFICGCLHGIREGHRIVAEHKEEAMKEWAKRKAKVRANSNRQKSAQSAETRRRRK